MGTISGVAAPLRAADLVDNFSGDLIDEPVVNGSAYFTLRFKCSNCSCVDARTEGQVNGLDSTITTCETSQHLKMRVLQES